jgi:hypothetical protein
MVRAVAQNALAAVVAHSEAGVVLAASLSLLVRSAAYKERFAAERESLELEACFAWLTHVVLVSPMGFPARNSCTFGAKSSLKPLQFPPAWTDKFRLSSLCVTALRLSCTIFLMYFI